MPAGVQRKRHRFHVLRACETVHPMLPAGKSTLLKQTAIIVILGHMGCFVPAAEATLQLTDRVCARVRHRHCCQREDAHMKLLSSAGALTLVIVHACARESADWHRGRHAGQRIDIPQGDAGVGECAGHNYGAFARAAGRAWARVSARVAMRAHPIGGVTTLALSRKSCS